jgi:nitroimidazol reductase NimA-like FMN-containing flavoprotein (pyridoxamine 5'-phosphate oxidase superfamily)
MDRGIEVCILDLLRQHNVLTLATVREDDWPQATTVGYVHDGLTLYVGCAANSQKLRNIERCNKVSLTIDHDQGHWSRIRGLSMGATAEVVTDPAEIARATELILAKYPQTHVYAEARAGQLRLPEDHTEGDLGPGLQQGLRSHSVGRSLSRLTEPRS